MQMFEQNILKKWCLKQNYVKMECAFNSYIIMKKHTLLRNGSI